MNDTIGELLKKAGDLGLIFEDDGTPAAHLHAIEKELRLASDFKSCVMEASVALVTAMSIPDQEQFLRLMMKRNRHTAKLMGDLGKVFENNWSAPNG